MVEILDKIENYADTAGDGHWEYLPYYNTVHHDAVTHTVHHDAVTRWIEDY